MKTVVLLACLLASACASVAAKVPTPAAEQPDPKERTLWLVCKPAETGIPSIPEDYPPHSPPCPDAVPIKYRHYPIRVGSLYTGDVPRLKTREVVRQWNAWLGAPVLRYDDNASAVDIQVLFEGENPMGYLGYAEPIWNVQTNDWLCSAYVWDEGVTLMRTAEHEVGHCLGLSHDGTDYLDDDYDVPWSVMKQGVKALNHRLTAADRAALRALYGLK